MIPTSAAFTQLLSMLAPLANEARITLPSELSPDDILQKTRDFANNFFTEANIGWMNPQQIQISHLVDLFQRIQVPNPPYRLGQYITVLCMHIGADGNNIKVLYQPLICPVDLLGIGNRNFYLPGDPGRTYAGPSDFYDYDGNVFNSLSDAEVSQYLDAYQGRMRSHKTDRNLPHQMPTPFLHDLPGRFGDTAFAIYPFREIFNISHPILADGNIADLEHGTITVLNASTLYPLGQDGRNKHHFVLAIDQTDGGGVQYTSNIDLTSLCPPGRYSVSYTVY